MSTPRRLPPRSSGTPMMWTDFMGSRFLPRGCDFRPQIARDLRSRGATVADAVGNADASKAAAGHEQTRMLLQCLVERAQSRKVPNVVLRGRSFPSVHAAEKRIAGDAEERPKCRNGQGGQLRIRFGQRPGVAGTADEGSQQHASLRRATGPLRRQP